MTIKIRISTPSKPPSAVKIKVALHRELTKLWKGAGQAFIRKVALEGVVKVDTGMSRASLLPLARAVRLLTAVRASITAERASRGRKASSRPIGPDGKPRTIAAGIRAGNDAFEYSVGTPTNPKFIFEFEIKVLQYLIREEGADGVKAWNSILKGRRAFLNHINVYSTEAMRRGLRGLNG